MREDVSKSQMLADVGKFTALTILFCLLVAFLPELSFLTLALCPLPVLVIAVRHSINAGLAAVLISGVILFPLIGTASATTLLLIIAFLGLGYFLAVENEISFAGAMAAGTVLVAVAIVTFGLLTFQIAKVNIVAQQIAGIRKEVTALKKEYVKRGISEAQFEEQFQPVYESFEIFPKIVPAGIALFSAWITFLSLMISGLALGRLKKTAIPRPAFKDWQMPWYFAWGYILGLAGTFFSSYLGPYQQMGRIAGMNFLVLFNLLFLVQGFCIIYFYMDKYKVRNVLRALGIGLLIAIPLASPMVAWFGLLDVWLNFRKMPTKA